MKSITLFLIYFTGTFSLQLTQLSPEVVPSLW